MTVRFQTHGCWWAKLSRWVFGGVSLSLAISLSAATYTVTSVSDSGAGSLRQAIINANANTGLDTILFSVGTGAITINLASALPAITDPVLIDGTSQPGYAGKPLVEINGASIAAGTDGITISSGGTTLRDLAVNRCARDAIRILGPNGTNVIQGNFLGTDPTGTIARANGEGGILINGSPGNLIGGVASSNRNLISGGNQNGVYLLGAGAASNSVQGNYIGTDITGGKRLGNVNQWF